jgi:DNA-binding response OmpR family regulator
VLLVDSAEPCGLAEVIKGCGLNVTVVGTPEAALFEFGQHAVDAVVASIPLSGIGTAGLCRELRVRGRTPVLVVSPRRNSDWLDALAAGADDFVMLPCEGRELKARLHALVRRARGSLSPGRAVTVGELTVRLGGGIVQAVPRLALTPVQATLLEHLAAHRGVVLGEQSLRERVDVVHGPMSEVQFAAELRSLQTAVAVASGVPEALGEVTAQSWRFADRSE